MFIVFVYVYLYIVEECFVDIFVGENLFSRLYIVVALQVVCFCGLKLVSKRMFSSVFYALWSRGKFSSMDAFSHGDTSCHRFSLLRSLSVETLLVMIVLSQLSVELDFRHGFAVDGFHRRYQSSFYER